MTMLDYFNAEHLALIPTEWAYIVLLVICILEGLPVVGSLIAGGTITFAVGALAFAGVVDPVIAIFIAAMGSFAGDMFGFFMLRKYGEKITILRTLIARVRDSQTWLSDTFDRRYFAITIVSRLLPFVRSAPSLIAAVRKIPAVGYVVASIIASLLWATTGIAAGYGLSEILDIKYIVAATVAFCVASATWGIIKHVRSK